MRDEWARGLRAALYLSGVGLPVEVLWLARASHRRAHGEALPEDAVELGANLTRIEWFMAVFISVPQVCIQVRAGVCDS